MRSLSAAMMPPKSGLRRARWRAWHDADFRGARSAKPPPIRTGAPSGLRIDFVEGLARIAERVDAGGHTAIDGNLQQDLLDFVPGEPVLQGALDVKLQFVRPVQGAEHRQVDDRARAPVEPGPCPQRAPAEL